MPELGFRDGRASFLSYVAILENRDFARSRNDKPAPFLLPDESRNSFWQQGLDVSMMTDMQITATKSQSTMSKGCPFARK